MIIVFMGPPGSGKGTQSKIISNRLGIPQLSTGDMLRAGIAAGSELGLKAKSFMDRGDLVPDQVVIGLIAERSLQADCKLGFILDGFPRTLAQAESLDQMLGDRNRKIEHVLSLEVNDDDIVLRMAGRRVCSDCGATYHVQFNPYSGAVCSKSKSNCNLVHRSDDQEDVVRNRLKVYHSQTSPLIAYYTRQGLVRSVRGSQAPQEVTADLLKSLGLVR